MVGQMDDKSTAQTAQQGGRGPHRQKSDVKDLYGLNAVIPFPQGERDDGHNLHDAKNDVASGRAIAKSSGTAVRRIEQRLTVFPDRQSPQIATPSERQLLLPTSLKKHKYSALLWFAICVVVPVILASIYYAFIASNQYVAEFRFSVTDTSTPMLPAASTGIMSLLGGGSGNTTSQNYIVTDFITSRQAVEELQRRIHVVDLYSKPGIDWWSRFPKKEPIEEFVNYWQSMVTARYDLITGIADAQIRAFSPADAQLIANTLVTLAEELINNIDKRSQEDAVRFAEKEVEKQKGHLQEAHDKLTAYRNKFGIIDPTTSVAASNSTLIQGLRANLAQLETQLATFQTQNLAPNAPAIVVLKSQIKSVREQLARTEAAVGTRNDNGSPLSTVVGQFEQLNLEVQFAQNMLTGAMQALTQARVNALTQHLYITPYVRPHLPQSSTYPRRFLSVLMVALMAFSFWLAGLMIVRSIRERFN